MTATSIFTLLVLLGLGQGPRSVPAATGLANAEALYASAAYEDALSQLQTVDDAGSTEQVEQYRALCLLALGRTAEAEQSLERLVTGSPFYQFSAAQVSPRLVTLFHSVRQRVLPGAARDLYADGKTLFDAKKYPEASKRFHDLLSILNDVDVADHAADFADLKMLAQGFVTLADAAEPAVAAPTLKAAPVAAPPAVVAPERVYSVEDADVVAPVDVDRRLPPWNPPTRAAVMPLGQGTLEVLIDEHGGVQSAVLRTPLSPFYDDALLAAARNWRFRPATRNGQPVKYLKRIIVRINVNR